MLVGEEQSEACLSYGRTKQGKLADQGAVMEE